MPPSNWKSASVRKTTATIETKHRHIQSLNKNMLQPSSTGNNMYNLEK